MASSAYTAGVDNFLGTSFAWPAGDVRAVLINPSLYTFSAAHSSLTDVPSGARIATLTASLASKVVSGGALSAADALFPSVPAGPAAQAIILYVHGASDAATKLLFYIDGFTVTPNGGDITIKWDTGVNKIVRFG